MITAEKVAEILTENPDVFDNILIVRAVDRATGEPALVVMGESLATGNVYSLGQFVPVSEKEFYERWDTDGDDRLSAAAPNPLYKDPTN